MSKGDLIPALVVVVCGVAGGLTHRDNPCLDTDGPQYACWLQEQEG